MKVIFCADYIDEEEDDDRLIINIILRDKTVDPLKEQISLLLCLLIMVKSMRLKC